MPTKFRYLPLSAALGESMKPNLTPKQHKAIAALFLCRTQAEAAESAGVSERTLRNWLEQDEFSRALLDRGRRIVSHSSARLKDLTGQAVDVLQSIMVDVNQPGSARVNAAKAIIELAHKAIETEDFSVRLADVEARLAEGEASNAPREASNAPREASASE
jgi:hypothetical protein